MSDFTHYAVLGLKADATGDEIKKAYRKAARHLHPDMNGGVELPMYLLAAEAHRVLSDPSLRASYDLTLARAARPAPPQPQPQPQPQPARSSPTPPRPAATEPAHETPVQEDPPASGPRPAGPSPAVRFVNPVALPRWAPAAAAAAITVGTVLLWVFIDRSGAHLTALTALATAGALLARRFGLTAILGAVTAVNVAGLDTASTATTYLAGAPGIALLAGGFLTLRTARRRRRGNSHFVGAKEAAEFFSWGTPGGLDATLNRYTGVPYAGAARAQSITAMRLEDALLSIPGARVVHAVHVPGHPEVVIDHVVLVGAKMALVGSMMRPGDRHFWSPYGSIAQGRDFATATDVTPQMVDAALDAFAGLGASRLAGWILLQPTIGRITVDNAGAPAGVRLATGQHGVRELVDWLQDDNDTDVVDLRLLRRVLDNVVIA